MYENISEERKLISYTNAEKRLAEVNTSCKLPLRLKLGFGFWLENCGSPVLTNNDDLVI